MVFEVSQTLHCFIPLYVCYLVLTWKLLLIHFTAALQLVTFGIDFGDSSETWLGLQS